MAHFAQLDENNIVTRVIVVSNEDVLNSDGEEVEQIGIDFCKNLFGSDTNWKQTSYNSNMRVRYAGPGDMYDEEYDAFIRPKPFPSWVLNAQTLDWESPIGPPPILTEAEIEYRCFYIWNEETQQWDLETPRPLKPELTEEQFLNRQFYRWDEITNTWVLVPVSNLPPSLTQEQIFSGKYYRWDYETESWILDTNLPPS